MRWQAGENNARVQSAAVDALLNLASIPDAALSSQAPLFLRPEKQTQWKRVLGRCVPACSSQKTTCHAGVSAKWGAGGKVFLGCLAFPHVPAMHGMHGTALACGQYEEVQCQVLEALALGYSSFGVS